MRALNARQEEILAWIGDGCPERDWPDYTHRATARSLQSQGLVKVKGHGANWAAEVTDAGRAVLDGTAPAQESGARRPPRLSRAGIRQGKPVLREDPSTAPAPSTAITAGELVERLMADSGTLRIVDPAPGERAAYRQAIAVVTATDGLLPEGKRITYQGRNRGDLVIRLADRPGAAQPERPAIPVPQDLDRDAAVIRHLIARPALLAVSEASRERALLLIQALDEECRRRGHATAHRGHEPGFDLVIDGERVSVLVSEEKDKVSQVPADALEKVKYEWQRVRPVTTETWSGRLTMTLLESRWNTRQWADRKRWTLDSRLPLLLEKAEETALARKEERARADREKEARRRLWEESVPRAQQAYVDDLNRERLAKQLESHAEAEAKRAYAAAVEQTARRLDPGPQRDAAEAWAAWIRGEADRIDPALALGKLQYRTPDDLPDWKISKYMPHQWSTSRPPD